jgi:hypothetical protein
VAEGVADATLEGAECIELLVEGETEVVGDESAMLSNSAAAPWLLFPSVLFLAMSGFHTTSQELALRDCGTELHMRNSGPLSTMKPGCVALPWSIISARKRAASMFMLNAWTCKMIWMTQWRREKTK